MQARQWYCSYALNSLNTWNFVKWPDSPNNHFGAKSGTTWAQVDDPAGAIYVIEGGSPDIWADDHLDFAVCPPHNRTTGWSVGQVGRPCAQRGIHQDRLNVLYFDGHVRTLRAGSTRPSMWTVQTDTDPPGF